MQKCNQDNQVGIVLFNAPSRDEAKRIRRVLLEEKLIRGGFIVHIEPGFMSDDGKVVEEDEYYVVYAHTLGELTGRAIEKIEQVSDSKGMSWDLKEGTDNYINWVGELKK